MSYVFKQIDPSYKTVTPFYAHKLWEINNVSIADLTANSTDGVVGDITMSIFYGKYTQSRWIGTASEQRTTDGEYTRNIWNSVYQLYYKDFQGKPYEYFKQGHVGVETRNYSEVVQVFSIPQKVIGTGIKPGSFRLDDGSYTFFDDGNGNILGYDNSWSSTTRAESVYNPNLKDFYYCSFLFNEGYKYPNPGSSFKVRSHGNLGATVPWNLDSTKGIAAPTHGPAYLEGTAVNVRNRFPGVINPYAKNYLDFRYSENVTGSAYVRIPHTEKLNFNANDDFTIVFYFEGNGLPAIDTTLITKNGRRRILRKRANANIVNGVAQYNDYISDEISLGPYPFAIEYNNANLVRFSVSDGVNTPSVSLSAQNGLIVCRKSGSLLSIGQASAFGAANSTTIDCLGSTTNDSDIFMGVRGDYIKDAIEKTVVDSPAPGTNQYSGRLGPVHFFNRALSTADLQKMHTNDYDNHYGNILYDQGHIIWTNNHGSFGSTFAQSTACSFNAMQFRSTKLITTNEYICAVGPGELNMTTNPSVLLQSQGKCDPIRGGETIQGPNEQGECYSFVTGSDFSPYVTGIGLYNDRGDLLVYGKMATPIKKATNCDTIFIVKWDQS